MHILTTVLLLYAVNIMIAELTLRSWDTVQASWSPQLQQPVWRPSGAAGELSTLACIYFCWTRPGTLASFKFDTLCTMQAPAQPRRRLTTRTLPRRQHAL